MINWDKFISSMPAWLDLKWAFCAAQECKRERRVWAAQHHQGQLLLVVLDRHEPQHWTADVHQSVKGKTCNNVVINVHGRLMSSNSIFDMYAVINFSFVMHQYSELLLTWSRGTSKQKSSPLHFLATLYASVMKFNISYLSMHTKILLTPRKWLH